jgi:hypothetical protein
MIFTRSVSPHLAAEWCGHVDAAAALAGCTRAHRADGTLVVLEGNLAMRIREELGEVYADARFAAAFGVVQDQLGHSTITLTADTYTSVLPETARTAAEHTAALLFPAASSGRRRDIRRQARREHCALRGHRIRNSGSGARALEPQRWRFYTPSLLPEVRAADQHIRLSRHDRGPRPSAMRPWAAGLVHGRRRRNPRTGAVGAVTPTARALCL